MTGPYRIGLSRLGGAVSAFRHTARRAAVRTADWLLGLFRNGLTGCFSGFRGPARLNRDGFDSRLRTLFAGQAETLAGRLHFVNLSKLRGHYGDSWPTLEAAVNEAVCAIIESHLEGRDFYTRATDAYVLVFPDLGSEDAQFRSRQIRQDIEEFLFESYQGDSGFELESVVSLVYGNEILNAPEPAEALDGSLHMRQIAQRQRTGMGGKKHEPAEPGDPQERQDIGSDHAADAHGSADDDMPPVATRPADADAVQLKFRSIWHTKSKKVTSFACIPSNPTARRRQLTPAETDLENLDAFLAKITGMATVDRQSTNLSFPLHFSTLVDRDTRQRFSDMTRYVAEDVRKRMVLEIVDIPLELKTMEREVLKATLTELDCSRIARVPLGTTGFALLKAIGVVSVGCDLSQSRLQESDILPLLDKHVEVANSHGLKTYIHGLNSISLTTAAVCAGFDHIDGETVGSITDLPDEAYPLDPRAMYAKVKKAS